MNIELLATTAFGLEALARRELEALDFKARTSEPGRLSFHGDASAICRANIWLRTAERVLVVIGRFEAEDFGELFDGTRALPWEQWIGPDDEFPVRGRSVKSQLSSVPACQRIVKKAIVERLREAHGTETLAETGPVRVIEVALLENRVTLTIDTTGAGLHKRGYRSLVGAAPLRETLAAALVQLSFWKDDRPLIDPFCGSGTIPIEAALIGTNRAPGLQRSFAAEAWPIVPANLWEEARADARSRIRPLQSRIIGYDADDNALSLARHHAERAGVGDLVHFQQQEFEDLESSREYGTIVTNPPYGERVGERHEVEALYQRFPVVLGRLPTWSHYVLTAMAEFERRVGRSADRRRKLYNGSLQCTYYQFHGPRQGAKRPQRGETQRADTQRAEAPGVATAPPALEEGATPPADGVSGNEPAAASPWQEPTVAPVAPNEGAGTTSTTPGQVFGSLSPRTQEQSGLFKNRLSKMVRHLRRWPTRQGIHCFRLYDRDIPEVPLLVDRYGEQLYIAEYERPHQRTAVEHTLWLEEMVRVACEVTGVAKEHAFMKRRQRMRGHEQYQRQEGDAAGRCVVEEGGLRFRVDLSKYLDTGLFLDHRITRGMVRDAVAGKRFLNLFCYTGSFTVYAAAGGAETTTSVDLSSKYLDWAADNMALNELLASRHQRISRDCMEFLREHPKEAAYDVAVVDPPTFSNSKGLDEDWDIQLQHADLLNLLLPLMSPGGVIYFSSNFRKFRFDWEAPNVEVREISAQTVPPDFRNRKIHRCWRITVQ